MSQGTPWTIATFQMDKEGDFTMEYSYEDLTDVPIGKMNEDWRRKYLGEFKVKARN